MTKKLVSVILCLLVIAGLCGCSRTYDVFVNESPFSVVERGKNYAICKHDETGVYYVIYSPAWDYAGGISVMLNPDGTAYTGE